MHARVLGGRDVPDPFEVPSEMTLIGEANLISHLRGRNAGAQQDAATFDAQLQLVGVWGNPRMACERTHQAKAAQRRQCNELVENDCLVAVLVQIMLPAPPPPPSLDIPSCPSLPPPPV